MSMRVIWDVHCPNLTGYKRLLVIPMINQAVQNM